MTLLDFHVHIYSCFDLKVFFDSVQRNFHTAAMQISGESKYSAILMLTDWAGKNWFQTVSELIDEPEERRKQSLGDRTWFRSGEGGVYGFADEDGNKIFVVSGRKSVTSENLEVLALTTEDCSFADGQSLADTVNTIVASDSIPFIPWAVGKWLGKRGQVLDELIATFDPQQYFLCDNGNRPFFWTNPEHFKTFVDKGGRLLSGSDPLHFSSEVGRAGCFGCCVEEVLDGERPVSWLRSVLGDSSIEVNLYGKLDTQWRFLRNQLTMQLLKRKWKNSYYRG